MVQTGARGFARPEEHPAAERFLAPEIPASPGFAHHTCQWSIGVVRGRERATSEDSHPEDVEKVARHRLQVRARRLRRGCGLAVVDFEEDLLVGNVARGQVECRSHALDAGKLGERAERAGRR